MKINDKVKNKSGRTGVIDGFGRRPSPSSEADALTVKTHAIVRWDDGSRASVKRDELELVKPDDGG